MKRFFTVPRAIAAGVILLASVAWSLPRISQGVCRDRLQRTLQSEMGRKVDIGQVDLRLLPTPGFEIADVRIAEDPSIGAEPAAYVGTLVARPRWIDLLRGKFTVGAVRLEDANINLTRTGESAGSVRWNFASLGSKGGGELPSIYMSGGRVNFKFGDTKSIFYLLDTDVEVSSGATPGSPLKIRIEGQPARTDRPSRGFGSFVASGTWNQNDHSLEMDVKLAKSELSDLLTLFEGGESSLLGTVRGDAHLAGPISKIGITGHLSVAELHGWNQLPPGGSAWPLTISGTLDIPHQIAEFEAHAAGNPAPLAAHLRAADFLGKPRWAAIVNLDGIPVAPLTGIARSFGIAVPADLILDGAAQGSIGYSTANSPGLAAGQGMQGQVRISNATLAAQGAPPLKIPQADMRFSGTSIELAPAPIVNDAGESAQIAGSYDTASNDMRVSLTTGGMAIASLRRQISIAGAPVIGLATSGTWSGSLSYENNDAGWAGGIHLTDTDIPFEAFAQPLHVREADATIGPEGLQVKRLQVTLGNISAQGEYRYETGAPRPHRFRLSSASADAGELEAMLRPTLRRAGFLTYAFNFGRVPEPDWLRAMHAEGSVRFGELRVAGTSLGSFSTNVAWDGVEVRLTGMKAGISDAVFTGNAAVHLAARAPRYEVNGSLAGLLWRGGTLDASVALTTSGSGTDLLSNLHAEGAFHGRKLDIAPPDPWDSADGRFDLDWSRAVPHLRLPALTVETGGSKWTGAADTGDGGQMVLKLADGAKKMEASGALLRGEQLKVTQ